MNSHSVYEWIGLSLATALGAVAFGDYLVSAISGLVARRWPVVAGVVTSSKIEQIPSRVGHYYKPCVEYTYSVADVTYTGNQRRFSDDDFAFKSSATSRLAKYASGVQVPVHYDPNDPSSSVLEPGNESSTYLGIVPCGAWFLFALALLLGYIH
jgi:uncharacterized protein DUF3592